MKRLIYIVAALLSAGLLYGCWTHRLPMDVMEAWGFVTGAWCVWLTVKENIWNWPIGIANSVFYIVVFLHARLFADMTLQVVYVVFGFLGWYWWLKGGELHTRLNVTRVSLPMGTVIAAVVALSTWGMTLFLDHVHDSAPFLDALTTTMSLAAQFMLTKKMFENWHVWIAADVIYIGLYAYKHLYLTSGLYVLFLVMCLYGLRDWRRSMSRARPSGAPAESAAYG